MRPVKLLRPRPAEDAIGRPRLLRALEGARACPLVLLSGPAGYGKTTVLGQWLDTTTRPAGWVTLDDRDDAPGVVTHLVGALQALLPGVGRETLSLLRLPGRVAPADLGAALADDLAARDGGTSEVILVLDDLHEVADTGVYELLNALLRYPLPQAQLVIATRVDPPLPLARLRARGQLLELRAADLRFTAEEASAYLREAAPAAPPGVAEALAGGAEGWAAGLRLAAVALPRGANAAEVGGAFAGQRQALALEYLLEEVLARQPREFQDALLRTALPERLCAPLCDVLLAPGDSPPGVGGPGGGAPGEGAPGEAFLDAVARANLFLTRLDDPDGRPDHPDHLGPPADATLTVAAEGTEAWYRYHPLFRELLLRQGRARLAPGAVSALHARAGAWFGAVGMIEEGVVHLLAAGEGDAAAALVERRVGRAYMAEEWPAMERWLDLLPPEVVGRRPAALLARGRVAQRNGRYEAISPLVAAAQALLDAPPDGAATGDSATVTRRNRLALEAEGRALLAFARYSEGDIAGAHAAAGLALAQPEAEPFTRALAIVYDVLGTLATDGVDAAARRLDSRAGDAATGSTGFDLSGALIGLASAQLLAGRLQQAEQTGRALLSRGEEGGVPQCRWWGRVFLGAVRYEQDRLDEAEAHFRAALEERNGLALLAWREAAFGLALTLQARGHPTAAGRALDGLADALVKTANTRQLALLASFRAHLAWRRGDPAAAQGWLRAAGSTRQHWMHSVTGLAPLTRERAAQLDGPAPAARGTPDDLQALLAETERLHADKRRAEVLAVLALSEDARGQPEAALQALAQALDLGEPGGLVRTFLDLGPALSALLQRLAGRRPSSAYLAGLLAAGATAGDPAGAEEAPMQAAAVATLPAPRPSPGPDSEPDLERGPLLEPLTGRELEVLIRLTQRWSNKEIAGALHVTPETVKTHAAHVYAKLGVSGRREAARRAEELRLFGAAEGVAGGRVGAG